MTFPIDKRLVPIVMYPAPDVVPEVLRAIEAMPVERWNPCATLDELVDAALPFLEESGARSWDFRWSMERHFSEPYGPLPKATERFMAGVPDMFLSDAAATTTAHDVAPLVEPFAFEADSELSEEYVTWLKKLMFAHGECMPPFFGSDDVTIDMFLGTDEWSLKHAPDASSRLRMNNFISEECKHTFMFYSLYAEFDPNLPFEIHQYEQEIFRAYEGMSAEKTWLDRSLNNMLSDRFGVYQGFEWVRSSYAPLARVALQVVKDERGHSNMGYLHTRACLESGGPEARQAAQRRIDEYWYPYFMAAFGSADSRNNAEWRKWGLKQRSNAELRAAYHAEVAEVLVSLGLEAPDPDEALELGLAKVAEQRVAAKH